MYVLVDFPSSPLTPFTHLFYDIKDENPSHFFDITINTINSPFYKCSLHQNSTVVSTKVLSSKIIKYILYIMFFVCVCVSPLPSSPSPPSWYPFYLKIS